MLTATLFHAPNSGAGGNNAPRPVAQTMQPGPPALRPSPVPPQQPRMVRGYLDLDGELSQ
jgi:hypothetical protein